MMKKALFVFSILAILLFSFTLPNTEHKDDASGTAYAVTWKTNSGRWSAVGPVQATWSTYDSEEEALGHVINEDRDGFYLSRAYTCGKYTVYSLGYDYESYDTDAMSYVRKRGYDCVRP